MSDGWLVESYWRLPTARAYSQTYKSGMVRPIEVAVCHWTATPYPRERRHGPSDLERFERWSRREAGPSTHFVVCRGGEVVQFAPLTERTWHAGGSVWVRPDGSEERQVNSVSVGIDIENAGPLCLDEDGAVVDCYGGAWHGSQPTMVDGELFEAPTTYQVEALVGLVAKLCGEVPALREPRVWVGHSDIKATKRDPGPLFPWDDVLAEVGRHEHV